MVSVARPSKKRPLWPVPGTRSAIVTSAPDTPNVAARSVAGNRAGVDQTVDPSEAERLAHDVLVRHRIDTSVLLVAEEPDAGARRVVLREPLPPLFAPSHVEIDQTPRHRERRGRYALVKCSESS
jgi:hypothetical protein